ncbi:MAG TPA: hypothetical protein VE172_23640 [Stackebrandtia sp.]|jgi:hypothetical protein|uniref:hypothetical protein n=1 Tax=Stackebrandtia sp. TaxID=2023065 RepID=UPI002D73D34D|nr:hypothetical protein [Stackebrandtia sp.]HZE41802.1 hypothetical protein [Stackebrandtia sp.]
MTPSGTERIPDHMTRDQVVGRLIAWLGTERAPALASMVDSFVARFGAGGPEECEQSLMWAVHIAKEHDHVDLDTAVYLAAQLGDIGIDIAQLKPVSVLRCRECE